MVAGAELRVLQPVRVVLLVLGPEIPQVQVLVLVHLGLDGGIVRLGLLVARHAGSGVEQRQKFGVAHFPGLFPVDAQLPGLLQVLDDLGPGLADTGADLRVVEAHRLQSQHFTNHFT
ncbi:hypothetical protein SDC9_202201 [bioreactor metagenome]|uniref:Uncharacterized protein n=1 Tax=bioreactor metagenome TaxID=1076179 RepID=A0A645IT21_9ZZZZ